MSAGKNNAPLGHLRNLRSVGPATLKDLHALGIDNIESLAAADPRELYKRLCLLNGPTDICMLDVFCCAHAQAQALTAAHGHAQGQSHGQPPTTALPAEMCDWFWWSRLRKSTGAGA